MSKESLTPDFWDIAQPLYQHAVDSELEVLMQEAPGVVSTARLVREDTPLGDALFSVLEEVLTDRERWVLEAWVFQRLGVRAIGQQLALSKSQVWRIKETALAKLRVALADAPAVRARLGLPQHSSDTAVLSEEFPCFQEETVEANHV